MRQFLADIRKRSRLHDIDAALRYATHVLHLGHRQLFYGTAADYKQSDAARRFLGGRKI